MRLAQAFVSVQHVVPSLSGPACPGGMMGSQGEASVLILNETIFFTKADIRV